MDGSKTGHEWRSLHEQLHLKQGRIVPVKRDPHTHLQLVHILPFNDVTKDFTRSNFITDMEHLEDSDSIKLFSHTHMQPLSTDMARKTLNDPLEKYFNTTIKHNMISGIEGVKPISNVNKADRSDSWYEGKMTQRTVPSVSRKPAHRNFTPGSHIVSDIGEVPLADRNGHKYYVVFKDMCTQFRKVYRMRTKDELPIGYMCVHGAPAGM
jgi:hypothetical protein